MSTRLSVAFGALGLTCIALLGASWVHQRSADAAITQLTQTEMLRLHTVMALQSLCSDTTPRVIALNRSKDPAIAQLFGPEIGPRVKQITEMETRIQSWMNGPAEQAWFEEFHRSAELVRAGLGAVGKARAAGDDAAADRAFAEAFMPYVDRYTGQLAELVEMQKARFNAQAVALQETGWARWTVATWIAMTLLLAAGVMVIALLRMIGRAMLEANHVAAEVAQGNLTVRADERGHHEFAVLNRSLNEMTTALHKVVQQVREGTDHITTASQEIAQGNLDLSERTERQASHLQQTASTMDELATTVRRTADTATQANDLSGRATEIAGRGDEAVNQVVLTMTQIEQSSRRIEDIIGVIDGISFQTNILALNAAVEAARAGEQGRGFAVVAGEVRQLAQRSANAAKEIKQLITDSSDRVQAGSVQVQTAGRTMAELQASVRQVTTLIAEIHTAAEEQQKGISGVSHAVNELDRSTQQNSAMVEQSAAAAAAMREQAATLAEMVAIFRVTADAEH